MNGKSLLRWLGPACTALVGILDAILARTGIIPDLMFRGDFYFPLSALILFISLLAAIIWAVISVGRMVAEKRLQRSLEQVRAAQAQEKQRFLRRLDHELKNPITTIRLGVVNLPEMVKPITDDEATGACSRRPPRGGRGWRSRRDWTGTWETLQGAEEGATCDRKP